MIFAAQAGPAIMNARAHRVEQRMRARYETLMEVTPVGVLLFDMFQSEIRSRTRKPCAPSPCWACRTSA